MPLLAFRCVFAPSLMSCILLCHVNRCMRSLAQCSVLHGSQSGYSANCHVLHVIQIVHCTKIALGKSQTALQSTYSITALFCSILLLAPVATYASACCPMRFCYLFDIRPSDCPSLRFVSNAAWGVLLCPVQHGNQSGYSAPQCRGLGASGPFRCSCTGPLCFAN